MPSSHPPFLSQAAAGGEDCGMGHESLTLPHPLFFSLTVKAWPHDLEVADYQPAVQGKYWSSAGKSACIGCGSPGTNSLHTLEQEHWGSLVSCSKGDRKQRMEWHRGLVVMLSLKQCSWWELWAKGLPQKVAKSWTLSHWLKNMYYSSLPHIC